MIVDPSATKGRFIKYDGLPTSGPISGTGFFELQDKLTVPTATPAWLAKVCDVDHCLLSSIVVLG
jgi:hypothetical protein